MRFFALLVAAATVSACGSSPLLYTASPATPDTAVDGQATEWPSALRPVPDESGLSVGFRHDGADLVVAVIAGDDRQARRIAVGGLRVWVDPMGGTDRALGIRYPSPEAPDARSVVRNGPRAGGPAASDDPQRLRRRFESGLDQMEVTRGILTQRAAADGSFGGLAASATWGVRGLVVEMRIPLTAAPGLLETSADGTVGIGVELLDVRTTAMQARMQNGRRPARPREGADDRPMPPAEGPAVEPEIDIATVTRWMKVGLE